MKICKKVSIIMDIVSFCFFFIYKIIFYNLYIVLYVFYIIFLDYKIGWFIFDVVILVIVVRWVNKLYIMW